MKTIPSFGSVIRAARLGYRYAPEFRLFIRISGNGPFRVDIAPATFEGPDSKKVVYRDVEYSRWWEGATNMLDFLPAMNKYQGRSQPLTFWVDDDGCEISKEAPCLVAEKHEKLPEAQAQPMNTSEQPDLSQSEASQEDDIPLPAAETDNS